MTQSTVPMTGHSQQKRSHHTDGSSVQSQTLSPVPTQQLLWGPRSLAPSPRLPRVHDDGRGAEAVLQVGRPGRGGGLHCRVPWGGSWLSISAQEYKNCFLLWIWTKWTGPGTSMMTQEFMGMFATETGNPEVSGGKSISWQQRAVGRVRVSLLLRGLWPIHLMQGGDDMSRWRQLCRVPDWSPRQRA